MTETKMQLGIIDFPYFVNEIRIIDPCYDITDDIVNYSRVEMFKGGRYIAYVYKNEEGRSSALELVPMSDEDDVVYTERLEGVGVDSGQAGFFRLEQYDDHCDSKKWYDSVCEITLNKENGYCGLVDDWGVVSESGYGDGCYSVLVARNEVGWVTAAKLIFIEENEEWEDEYEENEWDIND